MTALTDAALDRLLQRAQSRFSWTERAERYLLVRRWTSRTATLYRCRGADGGRPDIVVKVGDHWQPDRPRELYSEMHRLATELPAEEGATVAVPAPLGWDYAPPALVLPFVEGIDLPQLLNGGPDDTRGRGGWEPTAVLARCGEALGAYHSRFLPRDELAAAALSEAEADLRAAAGRIVASSRRIGGIKDRLAVSRRYGDFAHYNFRLSDGGVLYLLDAPASRSFAVVHRDIAGFTFELRKPAAGGGSRRQSAEQRAWRDDLCDAFLEGYATRGPVPHFTKTDRWVIQTYQGHLALGRARRRWRSARRREAVWYLVRWAGTALRLGLRGPGGPGGSAMAGSGDRDLSTERAEA